MRTTAPLHQNAFDRAVASDRKTHDAFVDDALHKLGSPGATPRNGWREQGRFAHALEGFKTLGPRTAATNDLIERGRHAVALPLGTSVTLPEDPRGSNRWTVVGAGTADKVDLARLDESGAVQRTTRRWPTLTSQNPQLFSQHLIPSTQPNGLPSRLVETADGGVRQVRVASPGVPPTIIGVGSMAEFDRKLGLSRLRPLPTAPVSGINAGSLVEAAGTRIDKIVLSGLTGPSLGVETLAGVNEKLPDPAVARDMARIERASSFLESLGVRPRGPVPDSPLLLRTNGFDTIGNAYASWTEGGTLVGTSPADPMVTRTYLSPAGHKVEGSMWDGDRLVRRNMDGVIGHELGHSVTIRSWNLGSMAETNPMKLREQGTVGEAFSDLFGNAFSEQRDNGVRDMGRLRNGYGDLDQYRALLKANPKMSPHSGTQLVTKPMLLVQQAHDWRTVGEVTASATNRLSAMLHRGEIASVGIPEAATALRDSAAARWGMDSELVKGLTEAWTKLRVLTPG